jgi:hypothetical protein
LRRLEATPKTLEGIVDEFETAQASLKAPGLPGWWEKVIPQLDAARAESLQRAARNRDISHRAISVVLAGWGFDVTPSKVAHWRRNHAG